MSAFSLRAVSIVLSTALLPISGLVPASPSSAAVGDASLRTVAAANPNADADEIGEWQVTDLGEARYRLEWASPTPLPLGADRPRVVDADGSSLPTSIGADGRTVTAEVQSTAAPDTSTYDVMLSGRALDEPAPSPSLPAAPPKQTALGALLDDDPAEVGPYRTVTTDYSGPGIEVPGFATPVEFVGHAVMPAADAETGPRPLVLFLHGRHGYCYAGTDDTSDAWPCKKPSKEIESQLGYDYIQQRLASQGYATVSIRVNGINAQDYAADDGGAAARAQLIRRHLDKWAATAAADSLDMNRVILVGHSRGGEGVNRASLQIPTDAPYRIAGQVLIAPTDFAGQTAPYVPTVTMLPSCDGDVSDLQGQQFTDLSRDLNPDDTSLKSSVFVVGANHNFFNTEWTPGASTAPSDDDWWGPATKACGTKDPNRLTAAQQRAVGLAYVAGAVHLFASAESQYAPMFTGDDVRVASTGSAVVHSHSLGGGASVLRPGKELAISAGGTGALEVCRGLTTERSDTCGRTAGSSELTPHWYPGVHGPTPKKALSFAWSHAGQTGRLTSSVPIDLSRPDARLVLRAVADQTIGRQRMALALTDGSGRTVTVTPEGNGTLARLPGGRNVGKWWAQSVVVAASAVPTTGGFDAADVRAIELVGSSRKGHVIVLDAQAGTSTLAAVPFTRSPLLQVGATRQQEGTAGERTAIVPITVTGTLTTRASFHYSLMGPRGEQTRTSVTLQPGQRSVEVRVPYRADKYFGADRQFFVSAWADAGVMTDVNVGTATVLDDDPMPRVTVSAAQRVVKEGDKIRVRVKISAPFADGADIDARFVKVARPYATVADLSKKVVGSDLPRKTPLWKSDVWIWKTLNKGEKYVDIVIPTSRHGQSLAKRTLKLAVELTPPRGKAVKKSVVVTIVRR